MRPELFVIPYLNISIKSYGTLMVIGFICAMYLGRWLARRYRENPEHISNYTVYAMIAGVVGARLFHVIHYFDQYRDNLMDIFKLWNGGLEFLGGFIAALLVSIYYFKRFKLNSLKFMDILAPALMLGLGFGRIGCFMNGCCFGKSSDLPWAVRFPVTNTLTDMQVGSNSVQHRRFSLPFNHQLNPDRDRGYDQPEIPLPDDYYDGYIDRQGHYVATLEMVSPQERPNYHRYVKRPDELTDTQLQAMEPGHPYCMHPVHPTQLYSSLNGFAIMVLLMWIHKKQYKRFKQGQPVAWGLATAILLICYGPARIILEYLRADNPKEFTGLTISQNLSVLAFLAGLTLLIFVLKRFRKTLRAPS